MAEIDTIIKGLNAHLHTLIDQIPPTDNYKAYCFNVVCEGIPGIATVIYAGHDPTQNKESFSRLCKYLKKGVDDLESEISASE